MGRNNFTFNVNVVFVFGEIGLMFSCCKNGFHTFDGLLAVYTSLSSPPGFHTNFISTDDTERYK